MDTVAFGSRNVEPGEKRRLVRDVFEGVATRYDLMNDLMSGGLHRRWRRDLVARVSERDARLTLDLAGGTGDIAVRLLRRFPSARVTVCDSSTAMLEEGRRRTWNLGLARELSWLAADSAGLPLAGDAFSLVTCAFGLRNFAEPEAALREAARVLRPGGRILCLEFAPRAHGLDRFYEGYLRTVLPALGARMAGRKDAYRYLAESIRRFASPDEVTDMLRDGGFGTLRRVAYAGGICCLHSARRR